MGLSAVMSILQLKDILLGLQYAESFKKSKALTKRRITSVWSWRLTQEFRQIRIIWILDFKFRKDPEAPEFHCASAGATRQRQSYLADDIHPSLLHCRRNIFHRRNKDFFKCMLGRIQHPSTLQISVPRRNGMQSVDSFVELPEDITCVNGLLISNVRWTWDISKLDEYWFRAFIPSNNPIQTGDQQHRAHQIVLVVFG